MITFALATLIASGVFLKRAQARIGYLALSEARERLVVIETLWSSGSSKVFLDFGILGNLDGLLKTSLGQRGTGLGAAVYKSGQSEPLTSVGTISYDSLDPHICRVFSQNGVQEIIIPISTQVSNYFIKAYFESEPGVPVFNCSNEWNFEVLDHTYLFISSVVWGGFVGLLFSVVSVVILYLLQLLKTIRSKNADIRDLDCKLHELYNISASWERYGEVLKWADSHILNLCSMAFDLKSTDLILLEEKSQKIKMCLSEFVAAMSLDHSLTLPKSRAIQLHITENLAAIFIKADKVRLTFIFANLLQNANRHGTGQIRVSILRGVTHTSIFVMNKISISKFNSGKGIGQKMVKKYCSEAGMVFAGRREGDDYIASVGIEN